MDSLLPRVSKPARYVGGEWNQVRKDHDSVDLTFALAFPDIYDIGMSNIGLRILYYILNQRSDIVAERVFAPWLDMEAEMREHNVLLASLETQTPLRDFDIIGLSLAYELTYTNVLNMLDLAGIPLMSADRADDDPIIIAGGHAVFNPEPMADFIDAFVIGEGEDVVLEIADSVKTSRGEPRSQRLRRLADVPGVYVPSLYDVTYKADGMVERFTPNEEGVPVKVTKRVVDSLDRASYPEAFVVPWLDVPHDRVAVEIMRGCTRGCRFCQAGVITRPLRQRSKDELIRQARRLLESSGYDEVSLVSLSSADYEGIAELIRELIDMKPEDRIGVSLPSLRADADCVGMVADIQRVRKSGLTFAPEAGTARLRDVINKNVTEDDLLAAVSAALDYGWRKLKLYFMIGLPTETDEDIAGIGDLVRKVFSLARDKRKPLAISVSVSSFVPKPQTPFQWRSQDRPEELKRKLELLQSMLRGRNLSLAWHAPHSSLLEAVMARGDRRLGQAVLTAWRSGCKFDGWEEGGDWEKWSEAFRRNDIDPAFYANRNRPYDEILPWDHIDSGVTKRFLMVQDRLADRGKAVGDCREGICLNCGVDELLDDDYSCATRCAEIQEE